MSRFIVNPIFNVNFTEESINEIRQKLPYNLDHFNIIKDDKNNIKGLVFEIKDITIIIKRQSKSLYVKFNLDLNSLNKYSVSGIQNKCGDIYNNIVDILNSKERNEAADFIQHKCKIIEFPYTKDEQPNIKVKPEQKISKLDKMLEHISKEND